jgi:UDP-N-acetylglucosamine diphosphorylase/glucosamine-1-phosphate N-acetyltransferase
MRICLFEDRRTVDLEPLTLTRPVFDLLCGQTMLGEKQVRHFAPSEAGALIRPSLAVLCRLHQPHIPVNDLAWLRAGPLVLVNGRWLPPPETAAKLDGPCLGTIGDDVAYAIVGPEQLADCSPSTLDDCLETWKTTLPQHEAPGRVVNYLWELVDANAEQLTLDFHWHLVQHGGTQPGAAPAGLTVHGPADRLWVDPTAQVEPMVLIDTTRGPVIIQREAVITAFTRIEGPCSIGPGTHVVGAKIRAGTTLGSHCRIGGEVEASIVQGYSNKYHDGFLGHSYVGEWVNLGAGTSNSDLRNDYGEVTVTVAGQARPTGLTKVGCFLGDHTKSGLGTLLNTGTNASIFCNLLPDGRLLPRYVPSFCSWWKGELRPQADFAALLATAAKVMQRRGCKLTEVHAALYRRLWDQTAGERNHILAEARARRLRQSA